MSHEGEKLNLIFFRRSSEIFTKRSNKFQNEFFLKIFLSLLRTKKYFRENFNKNL